MLFLCILKGHFKSYTVVQKQSPLVAKVGVEHAYLTFINIRLQVSVQLI